MERFKFVRKIRLLLVLTCLGAIFAGSFSKSSAGRVSAQNNDNAYLGKTCGEILIESKINRIEKNGSFILSGQIVNKCEGKLPLKYYPVLVLEKVGSSETEPQSDFYSTVNADPDKGLMTKDFLLKNENLSFELDITKMKWGKESSAFIPSENLFNSVPEGNYDLYLKLQVDNENIESKPFIIRSNKIKISIN